MKSCYSKANNLCSSLKSVPKVEGETIEMKIERIVNNKEPIKDGAPMIYSERKEGVIAAYNIRTDRFEIACDAMNKVQASIQARRDERAKVGETPVVNLNDNKGTESIQA